MISPEEQAVIDAAARVVDEAVAWCWANPPGLAEVFGDKAALLRRAVITYLLLQEPARNGEVEDEC